MKKMCCAEIGDMRDEVNGCARYCCSDTIDTGWH